MRPFDDWTLARMAGELERAGQALVLTLDTRSGPDTGIPDVDPSRGHAERQAASIAGWKSFWADSSPLCRLRNQWSPACRPTGVQANVQVAKGNLRELDRLVRTSIDSDTHLAYVPVRGDLEHFHEDAAKVAGIVASGLPAIVSSPTHEKILHPELFGSPVRLNLGGFSSNVEPVDGYWKNKAFLEVAGRELVPCSEHGLLDTVLDFHMRGHRRVFLKSTEVKRGTWTLDMPDGSTRDSVRADLWMLLRGVLHMRHFDTAYFVQPWLGFRREMRFFVVDGRILQAVPVRRADTIFDGTPGTRIEPRSCERHDGHASEPDRKRAAAYAVVARRVVAHLQGAPERGRIHPRGDYVLDMGETLDGRILPIELNGINNSGNYAADPARLVLALARSKARHMMETLAQDRRGDAPGSVDRAAVSPGWSTDIPRQTAAGTQFLVPVASSPEARYADACPGDTARVAAWNGWLACRVIRAESVQRGSLFFRDFSETFPASRLRDPALEAERESTWSREASLLQAFSAASVPTLLVTSRDDGKEGRITEARSRTGCAAIGDYNIDGPFLLQEPGAVASAQLAIRLMGLQVAGLGTALLCERAWPWRTYAFDLAPGEAYGDIVARIVATLRDALDGDSPQFSVYQWPKGGNIIRSLVGNSRHLGVGCDLVATHGGRVPQVPACRAASNVRISAAPCGKRHRMGQLWLRDVSVGSDGKQVPLDRWPAFASLMLSMDHGEVAAACVRESGSGPGDETLADLESDAIHSRAGLSGADGQFIDGLLSEDA